MIDDKVMWMSKISFENVIMIKSFQIWLKNNYENDMEKMMCYYETMWSYNYFTMINDFFNMSTNGHNKLQNVKNWSWLILYI